MQLIVHAGAEKCGSTSIQNYLADIDDELRSKKIFYTKNLRRVTDINLSHLPHVKKLFDNPTAKDLEKFASKILKLLDKVEKEGYKKVLFSYEGSMGIPMLNAPHKFYSSSEDVGRLLQILSKNLDVKLSYIVRRQDKFLESLYAQTVRGKYGNERTLYEFMNKIDIEDLSWKRVLEKFSNKATDVESFYAPLEAKPLNECIEWMLPEISIGKENSVVSNTRLHDLTIIFMRNLLSYEGKKIRKKIPHINKIFMNDNFLDNRVKDRVNRNKINNIITSAINKHFSKDFSNPAKLYRQNIDKYVKHISQQFSKKIDYKIEDHIIEIALREYIRAETEGFNFNQLSDFYRKSLLELYREDNKALFDKYLKKYSLDLWYPNS